MFTFNVRPLLWLYVFFMKSIYIFKIFILSFCIFFTPSLALPIIGIISDHEVNPKNKEILPVFKINSYYITALQNSCRGYDVGIIIIPIDKDSAHSYAQLLDALIIPDYKYDIDPKLYGQHKKSKTNFIPNDARIEFEIEMIREFMKTKKPILALGHGMHILNIVHGGTLIQDIASEKKLFGGINHLDNSGKAHEVEIEPNTLLADILAHDSKATNKGFKIWTNSMHNQALGTVGQGLKIIARTKDGNVESIQGMNQPFLLGVQWAPEYLVTISDAKLFDGFCKVVARK